MATYNPSTASNIIKNVEESYRTNSKGYPSSVGSYSTTPVTSGINVNVDPRFKAPSSAVSGAKTTPTTSSSSSKSSSSASSSSGAGDNAYLSYIQLVQAQQAAEQSRAEAAARAQREAAQNAYNRGMGYLNDAYNARANSLRDNYDSTVGQLGNAYNSSANKVNADAENALKQAYLNRMMSQKNMAQQMSAQGLSGGATESSIARLFNNYGNARNNIDTTRNSNISNLNDTYNNNLASALQSYNSALSNLDADRLQYAMNLENALANNEISTVENYQNALSRNNSNYLNALSDAVQSMMKYEYDKAKANNDVKLASVMQSESNANTNYPTASKVLGGATSGINEGTLESASANKYLDSLLKALRGA